MERIDTAIIDDIRDGLLDRYDRDQQIQQMIEEIGAEEGLNEQELAIVYQAYLEVKERMQYTANLLELWNQIDVVQTRMDLLHTYESLEQDLFGDVLKPSKPLGYGISNGDDQDYVMEQVNLEDVDENIDYSKFDHVWDPTPPEKRKPHFLDSQDSLLFVGPGDTHTEKIDRIDTTDLTDIIDTTDKKDTEKTKAQKKIDKLIKKQLKRVEKEWAKLAGKTKDKEAKLSKKEKSEKKSKDKAEKLAKKEAKLAKKEAKEAKKLEKLSKGGHTPTNLEKLAKKLEKAAKKDKDHKKDILANKDSKKEKQGKKK